MEAAMQDPLNSQTPRNEIQSSDPVVSDVRALIQRVRASIGLVEIAMTSTGRQDPDTADDFFILDDVTPRYLKLRSLLGAVDASLSAALHDA
jgi:CRISPR/Cas system type I-B associated protein Csh2 (Cas7 group RAMP superfamily)